MATTSTDRRYGVNAGLAFKAPCKAATTTNITLSGEQTIDGVALVTGDRCLVKDQTTASENGIYVVDTSSWEYDRDWDGTRDVKKGTSVRVTDGTLNVGYWYVTTSDPITPGTTSVSFSKSTNLSDGAVISAESITALRALDPDLLTDNDTIAVLGYTTAGDGGGGQFYWDAASSDADDGALTILPTGYAGTGRWKRSVKKRVVQLETFGCVGDNATDDAAALTKAFASGYNLIGKTGKTYLSTTAQTMSAYTTLNLNGATLKFTGTGAVKDLLPVNGCSVINGTIENAGSAASGSGDYQCPICIGDYAAGTGYNNIRLDGLSIVTNRSNGNGIIILGDSYNIKVSNINFPTSSVLARGILIHWGGSTTPSAGTTHPHNIKVRNITASNQTGMTTTSDGIVFVSGAYNIDINGVAGNAVGCGVLYYAGDYGTQYAGTAAAKLGLGLTLKNIALTNVTAYPVYTNGVGITGGTTYRVPLAIQGENIKITANGAADGIFLTYCDGSIWKNVEASGFTQHGFRVGRDVRNGKILGGKFFSNGDNGINFYDTTTVPSNWEVHGAYVYSNNVNANANPYDRAGIAVRDADRVRIDNCVFGVASETQFYSVRVENTSDTVWLNDNYTAGLAGGGVAYSLGSSTDYGINAMGRNNRAASGLTLHGGAPIFDYDEKGVRSFAGTAAPTAGTWAVGDTVRNSSPGLMGNVGWICTVAGTPGTWEMFGIIKDARVLGDVSSTLTALASHPTNIWNSPLTATRTVTLSTTNAYNGALFRITRTAAATGASTLDVGTGPLKSLAAGQWCDVEYADGAWYLAAFGSL